MERAEFSKGLAGFKELLAGLERIVKDPEAIARMQRRAIEKPTLLLGPTLVDYFGLDSSGCNGSESLPEED